MTDPDRTAQQREAARVERERRRAEREGLAAALGDPGAAREADTTDGRRGGPPKTAPIPDVEPWEGQDRDFEREADSEPALGTKRVSRSRRLEASAGSADGTGTRGERPSRGPGRRRGAPRAAGRPAPTGRRRFVWVARVVSLSAVALAAALIWFVIELFQPFSGQPHGRITVMIPPHLGAQQIGDLLARDSVVSSGFFFNLRALLSGDRGKLLSGTYHLQLGMSYGQVLTALMTPPPAVPVAEVTIIPGRTRRQVDALLRAQHVRGSYLAGTRRSRLLNPAQYGAPRRLDSLEGFLFPSTYQLVKPITIPALVADQLRTFEQEFSHVNLSYARSRHLTPYDVLIIASLVESETGTAHDRPLVASVIYNRLADGMPLGLDATTRYAVDNYTTPLTQSQLNSSSPYNTRNHLGLPPTPIDSPELASIEAAAHPARTNNLYFVAQVCGNGNSVFTGSYQQFLHYSAQYQAARSARGGKSPEVCK